MLLTIIIMLRANKNDENKDEILNCTLIMKIGFEFNMNCVGWYC